MAVAGYRNSTKAFRHDPTRFLRNGSKSQLVNHGQGGSRADWLSCLPTILWDEHARTDDERTWVWACEERIDTNSNIATGFPFTPEILTTNGQYRALGDFGSIEPISEFFCCAGVVLVAGPEQAICSPLSDCLHGCGYLSDLLTSALRATLAERGNLVQSPVRLMKLAS